MNGSWCGAIRDGVRITVQVTPNAKKTEIIGLLDDVLKIRLQAQPIEGKANEALIRYLAEMLGVSKSAVTVTHGQTSRRKIVEVAVRHLTVTDVQKILMQDAA